VKPQVTAVVPTRNRLGLLRRTMESIAAQRGVDVSIVVVNEASSDGTDLFLKEWNKTELVHIRNETPVFLPRARNLGLDAVSTEWVAFVDDDDLWAPDKLITQVKAAESTDAQWAVCGALSFRTATDFVFHRNPPIPVDVSGGLLHDNVIPGGGSGVLACADLVRSVGGFDPEMTFMEDWECWFRLAARGRPAAVDRPLVAYRIHAGQMSDNTDGLRDSIDRFVHKHQTHFLANRQRFDRSVTERVIGGRLLRCGKVHEARKAYVTSLMARPTIPALILCATSVVGPDFWLKLRSERLQRRIPQAWIREVQPWLTELESQ
jgi:glycosyltransferase involved in cell wall biosynthesis